VTASKEAPGVPSKGVPVLLPVVLSLGLAVIGALIVARVAVVAMRRLGLELYDVLEWFGIAEAPAQPSLGKSVVGGRWLYSAK
jgi:hypothetical protein